MTVLVPGATEPQPPQDWGVSCQPDHSRQIRASRYGVTVLRLFSRCKSPVLTHLGRCPQASLFHAFRSHSEERSTQAYLVPPLHLAAHSLVVGPIWPSAHRRGPRRPSR